MKGGIDPTGFRLIQRCFRDVKVEITGGMTVMVLLSRKSASRFWRAESSSGRERRSLEDNTSLVRLVSVAIEGESSEILA